MNPVSLTITNIGTGTCSLLGYPTIALFDTNGKALAFVYSHSGDMMVTARPPSAVDLAPGSSAFVTINKYRCDLGPGPRATALSLIVPGDSTQLRIALDQYATVYFCGSGDPGSTVVVSPIAETQAATLNEGTG
jgi:hypothetical protein